MRRLAEKDIPGMLEWMRDPEMSTHFRMDPARATEERAKAFVTAAQEDDESLHRACVDADDEYWGTISLKHIDTEAGVAEYAVAFRRCAQGTGAAAFATLGILDIAFVQLGLRRVVLEVLADNTRACAFYDKLGFIRVGEHEAIFEKDGQSHRMLDYCVWKDRRLPSVEGARMMEFPQHGDARGHLVVLEGNKDIPFDIRRAFYMYGSDVDVVRGDHANRESRFVLINVAGTSCVKVMDGRGREKLFRLDRPHTGVYIPNMLWKEMYGFSPDSVLLVLASTAYNNAEYIRTYDEYVECVKEMGSYG